MDAHTLKTLQQLKEKYRNFGFLLIGVFGSYARGENSTQSDIDILYDIDKKFLESYPGWSAIEQLEKIKDDLKKHLGISKVDLASADNNSQTFQHTVKNEIIYV